MSKGRMEAFSDGVFAVIITIMVLELKSPQGTSLAALKPMIPRFLQLSFEFHLRGHLLEQSSPPAAGSAACCWRRAVGESTSAVLAFADPLCHGVVGREPACAMARRALRCVAFVRFDRILHPDKNIDRVSGNRLNASEINWRGS